MSRTFLKWLGNKTRLIPEIGKVLPKGKRLVEPFVGSGAVTLAFKYPAYSIGDANEDILSVWSALLARPEAFIEEVERLFQTDPTDVRSYYEIRERFNRALDPWERAIYFMYLNRYGFNGLCRYNREGLFNTPYGWYKTVYFPKQELRLAAKHLKAAFTEGGGVEIVRGGFRKHLEKVVPGDVVYCDPPYIPISPTASFTGYTREGFTLDDHRYLAEKADKLRSQGIPTIISNSACVLTEEIYGSATRLYPVTVRRTISAKVETRNYVSEYLIVYE
ncbi:DNA adenine methylase [Escherichia coli]|uniref:DNA adenine methylase n=1 Tax=Escherichia coli TaxID=562 RepID=UPI0039BFC90C